MSQPERELGRHWDIFRGVALSIAAAAAGSAADYEHPIFTVPDLTAGAPSGTAGTLPQNQLRIARALIVPEAAITGVATNYFTWQLNQYRAGAVLVNTTLSSSVVAGAGVVVTPASITNIVPGMMLTFQGGTAETVMVLSVNYAAGTFTCNLANNHASASGLVNPPVTATVAFVSGTNASKFVPIQLAGIPNAILLPKDVVTIARVSSNATGLASPAATALLELTPAKFY
jgi:hypothetical protein